MTDFQTYLTQTNQVTQQELKKTLTVWNATASKKVPSLKRLFLIWQQNALGGKGIRAALVKIGYALGGYGKNKDILKIAAAYEILHASLLIHDDVIDKSNLRRGKKTIHHALGNTHYGLSQTICLGDLGFFLATKLIATSTFDPQKKTQALTYFSDVILDTILGEMLDIQLALPGKKKEEKDVMMLQTLKTASYTIAGPLVLGAMLAGAAESTQTKLKTFGEILGKAFQIQDDILGVFGSSRVMGKSATSDCEEGKNTLLIAYALKHASKQEKEILHNYYGKPGLTKAHHKSIQTIFKNSGALSYSQQQILVLAEKAYKMIPQLTQDPKQRILLETFITFLTEREK